MKINEFVKGMIPPWLLNRLSSYRYYQGRIVVEWEYMSGGWPVQAENPAIKGWNVESVLDAYRSAWPEFVRRLEARLPFGVGDANASPTQAEIDAHNTLTSYALVFTLAARQRTQLSMLDWGGGIGHYLLINQAILPDLDLDYHCKDAPVLVDHGRALFPQAHFHTDDSCLTRRYDFVLASGSLHYSQDWIGYAKRLAQAANEYLFVTRLPVVHRAESYVFVQRPYRQGYNTEYLSWCVNRSTLIGSIEEAGFELRREFLLGERPRIHRAPEQCEYRGFLFRRASED